MNRAVESNIAMIKRVASHLGHLRERVVFLGGAATALLITDSAAPDVRATMDVDVIVEIVSRSDYYRLTESLRSAGFTEDIKEGAPICRWLIDGIAVDVMPTDEEVLGFSNRWYRQAMQYATAKIISDDMAIRLVTSPYFLATKIDAFHNRGADDYVLSHDMEDIITLLDGRPEVVDEVRTAPEEVKAFLSQEFERFLQDRSFLDALPGHLLPDTASQQRTPLLMKRMQQIANHHYPA
jgi:predicted nucleotidyltransferase